MYPVLTQKQRLPPPQPPNPRTLLVPPPTPRPHPPRPALSPTNPAHHPLAHRLVPLGPHLPAHAPRLRRPPAHPPAGRHGLLAGRAPGRRERRAVGGRGVWKGRGVRCCVSRAVGGGVRRVGRGGTGAGGDGFVSGAWGVWCDEGVSGVGWDEPRWGGGGDVEGCAVGEGGRGVFDVEAVF